MGKRERIATVAAVSNGMVWFGLAVFVGAIAVQFAPSALAVLTSTVVDSVDGGLASDAEVGSV